MHEGRKQTNTWRAYAGSRLELCNALGRRRLKCHPSSRTGEKPAVRNDRGDRGDVGIIRSPVRASILPDCGGCPVMGIPTAILGPFAVTRANREVRGANAFVSCATTEPDFGAIPP